MSTKKQRAGWYQDPVEGVAALRYWDGAHWTAQVRRAHTTVVMTNHLLHLTLTLLTCGLWAPVWLLVAFNGPQPRTVYATLVTISPLPAHR